MVIVPNELLEAAAMMRATNPELWQRFLGGLRLYGGAVTGEMIRVDPALLPKAQGMAVGVAELINILTSAHEQLDLRRGRQHDTRFKPA